MRSTIKGKWPDAVNVQIVDFIVPQVALWDEQSIKISKQKCHKKKEQWKEGFENLQLFSAFFFFFFLVKCFCFTVVGQCPQPKTILSLSVHFHFLPVYCAMKKVVCAK